MCFCVLWVHVCVHVHAFFTTLGDHAAPWKWVLILLGPRSFRRLMWLMVGPEDQLSGTRQIPADKWAFLSYHSSHNPGQSKAKRGDVEARLKERNRKCSKGDGRRRRSDLTSPLQRGEAWGRNRGREKLNSFISPQRLKWQPPQCSINTCTCKVLKWSVHCNW